MFELSIPQATYPPGQSVGAVNTATAEETITLQIGSTEWSTLTGTVYFGCQISTDGGVTWETLFGSLIELGSVNKAGQPPTLTYQCPWLSGSQLRVVCVNPSATTSPPLSFSGQAA
ncbi:MAG: hypothetical protein ACLPXB_05065 [Thiobacillaceae bacterium]